MAKFFKRHKAKFAFLDRGARDSQTMETDENCQPLKSALKKSNCDFPPPEIFEDMPCCSSHPEPTFKVPKRVCFNDDTELSSVSSPRKSFPRTNPYFTLPRRTAQEFEKLRTWNEQNRPSFFPAIPPDAYSHSSITTSTTSDGFSSQDDASVSSDSSSKSSGSGLTKIIAGLKSLGIKGELYLSVIVLDGYLTISVDEARELVGPEEDELCNSYVRLSLMPDEEKRTQCKTTMVLNSNFPVFNQTFTIELLRGDYGKRLLISMWHRDQGSKKSHLLGCMAFSVRHLLQAAKTVEGWYFLLAPTFGRSKHMAVDKVNMLTFYGSVDRGLNSGSYKRRTPVGEVWL